MLFNHVFSTLSKYGFPYFEGNITKNGYTITFSELRDGKGKYVEIVEENGKSSVKISLTGNPSDDIVRVSEKECGLINFPFIISVFRKNNIPCNDERFKDGPPKIEDVDIEDFYDDDIDEGE